MTYFPPWRVKFFEKGGERARGATPATISLDWVTECSSRLTNLPRIPCALFLSFFRVIIQFRGISRSISGENYAKLSRIYRVIGLGRASRILRSGGNGTAPKVEENSTGEGNRREIRRWSARSPMERTMIRKEIDTATRLRERW